MKYLATMNYTIASILVCLGCGIAYYCYGNYMELQELTVKVEQRKNAKHELESHNNQLRKRLSELQTDPGVIERVIRKNVGWVKDGEVVYVFEVQPEWF